MFDDKARKQNEFNKEAIATKQELQKLRLGNLITKLQMQKYIKRLLEIQKEAVTAYGERNTVRLEY